MLPLLPLLLMACAGSYDGPLPSGEAPAIYGKVVSLIGSGLGDVRICVRDAELDCVTTPGDGDFLIEGLPEDADVVVDMDRESNLATSYLHHTTVDAEWRKTLMGQALVDSMLSKADTEAQPGQGHAMFILWTGPDYDTYDRVEGVRFTVDADGERFYQAGGGMPDPDADATTSAGSGGAFNLDPGTVWLTFTGATCRPWFSWDFEPGADVPMQIIAERASYMDLVCE